MEDVTQAPNDDKDPTESNGADIHSPESLEADTTARAVNETPPVFVRPVRSKPAQIAPEPQEIEATATTQSDTVEELNALLATQNTLDPIVPAVTSSEGEEANVTGATSNAESLQESASIPIEEAAPEDIRLDVPQAGISAPDIVVTTQPAPQESAPTPLAPRWADLPNVKTPKRWVALCLGITFLIYLAFVPVFLNYSSPPTGDQPFYLMDTISIVQNGDLNVKNNYDNRDEDKFYGLAPHPEGFVGMGAPYPLPPQIGPTTARPTYEWYGAHLPGLAIALVPAWVIGSWFSLWWPATVIFMCLVGALVAVNAFLLAHEVTGKLWIAFAVWLPIAFSSPVLTYSYMIFTELSTGLLVIYAFRRLAMGWGSNGPIRLTLIGLCIGYIPWLAWRAVPIAALLGLYALVQWWRYWRSTSSRKGEVRDQGSGVRGQESNVSSQASITKDIEYSPQQSRSSPWFKETGYGYRRVVDGGTRAENEQQKSTVKVVESKRRKEAVRVQQPVSPLKVLLSTVWMLIPLIISGVFLATYNRALYGSLAPTAIADSNYYFHWPWAGQDNLIKYANAVFGLLYDQQSGLLAYAPIYLLSAVGAIALFRSARRSDRGLLFWIAIVAVPYMALVAGFSGWNGVWCPPARYWATMVPLLAAPLGMSLYSLTRTRVRAIIYGSIYALLALPGILLGWFLIRDARLMWPNPSGAVFNWLATAPESPFKVDLLKWIPANTWPDETRQPYLSAWAIGVSMSIIFLGYALMVRPRVPMPMVASTRPRRWPLAAHGMVWLGVGAILIYGWLMANYKHLERKTILTQKQVWVLNPPVNGGSGIALMDNKLYITGYLAQSVSTLDLSTGTYDLIQPTLPDGTTLPFFRPGDVKVGPDGLIYVLNNAPNEQALLVLQPDGRVVRQVSLIGKTPIAVGLVFAPDGSGAYVSDMTGGRIIRYGPGFGDPLEAYGGATGSFNNIVGIVVDDDGTIYASESSPPIRVQQIDRSGKFVRDFKLECSPQFITTTGDWLDLSCSSGLISINKVTGKVQSVRYSENSLKPSAPTGVTYDPDGTLYVLDDDKVIQYTVQH